MGFLDENFLLRNKAAQTLYHEYAKEMPVIDYHCHLPPEHIAADHRFENLTQIWLYGDHYKWRAMRTNGVDERYCTGDKSDKEKFLKWAETVPYTLRNPLYHWTHLELQRYFGITEILNADTAEQIYEECSEKLRQEEYSVRNLLRKMNVAMVCTTDDPVDSLEYHKLLRQEGNPVTSNGVYRQAGTAHGETPRSRTSGQPDDGFGIPVRPAFRPDKAMNIADPLAFNAYISRLEEASGLSIGSFGEFMDALKQRHDYFAENGCSVSDHGLEKVYTAEFTEAGIRSVFDQVRSGRAVTPEAQRTFQSAMLQYLAEMDWEKGWVQQYHLGALRNNSTRMMQQLGPDTGWDSIGDFSQARELALFLDRLDRQGKLAKTILYNLNPADNELMATMTGNFNDGSFPGKIQWGSAWWFLDQKDGMIRQMNALSNMGLLSRFVGMITDSRSFLSYPRHEYFRRILCNLFGEDMESGELPRDMEWAGKIIQDICYYNARDYFNWQFLD